MTDELLALQAGVISRAQALATGEEPHDVRRRLRRREWVTLHPGVYVAHTGEPTWIQRAWAAVLYAGPGAALAAGSALRADGGPGWRGRDPGAPIQVAVDARRTVVAAPGLTVVRVASLAGRVRWTASPPRMRVEEATLDHALAQRDEHARFEALAAPVRSRATTAQRLLETVGGRARVRHRHWLVAALEDLRDGTTSVLERRFLELVERAHGLPTAERQRREQGTVATAYRDLRYPRFALVVELDGHAFHSAVTQRDLDLDRDLDVAVSQRVAVRLGWGQVVGRPCATAARLGQLLQLGGWTGSATACGPGCAVRGAG